MVLEYITHSIVFLFASFLILVTQSQIRDTIKFTNTKYQLFDEDDVSDELLIDDPAEIDESDDNYLLKQRIYKYTVDNTTALPFTRATKNIKLFLAEKTILLVSVASILYLFTYTAWYSFLISLI